MADSEEVSSSTPFFSEGHHYQAEPEPEPLLDPEPKQDLFSPEDIVDLVGGARDALERHRAEEEEGGLQVSTVTSTEPEPEPEPELVQVNEPEPEQVKEPEPEPPVEKPAPVEPEVVAPRAEPESSELDPPAPQSDALLAAAAREAAPSPAEAAAQPAVTQEPVAPASYVSSPPNAQPRLLMQFPTELGQKGDSPAPISPISPLHSPDSLEELSLTESPNQPPPPGSAAPLGSFSTAPPTTFSKDMPWEGEEGDSGPGRGKTKEDLLDSLAGQYLSLGKDSGPHNPCEDSGVSFSPEEKLISSDKSSTGPSPVNPLMVVRESYLTSSNPTENWDSPFLSSEDNSKVSMDSFNKETTPISSSRYEPDVCGNQSDEDEDLMYEVKKNNNPFEGYSPLADSGYSHFGEPKSDTRASKMSESPTPDLVQYGQTGESQENQASVLDEGKPFETSKMESLMESMSKFSSGPKEDEDDEEEEDSVLPPSLPDILKSSPLNPDKMDSGSSEGSPEEQSPILERRMMESPNPPINLSANNPFAFDTKVSLLKEMTEEMEAKSTDGTNVEESKSFGAFDLVKEAETAPPKVKEAESVPSKVKDTETTPLKVKDTETVPPKVKDEEPVHIEQKDWFSSNDPPKKPEGFEPLDFQSKKTANEDSDSESPTADSLSPVLEAMAKNPAIFNVETERTDPRMELDEPEVAEEVSEHEVSSEEFEFIERPPRGVIDEFLEALDTSKFSSPKPPEIPLDDDLSFVLKDTPPPASALPPEVEPEAPVQSSYRLLTQTSSQKTKAELETRPPAEEPAPRRSAESGKVFKMPNLNIRAVVELVYWRDVKTTGVVFGAALLLLLSLTVCSIVSVFSYIGLALLSVTICFRIYKGILQAIQKSDEGHPFKQYLGQEVALSEEMVHKYSDVVLEKLNRTVVELRRLFLVEDLVDSIKFAVLMWILTYVGALFNGLTLLILGLVGAFSCPIIYEKHQAQIDHYLALVNNQIKDVVGKVQAKVPGLKPKAE